MGKKCKRKVQWRILSLNELQSNKSSEEGAEEDCDDEDEAVQNNKSSIDASPPPQGYYPQHKSQGPNSRRPFHPNFYYPGDQKRFSAPFDPRGASFERGPRPRFFGGRSFHYDQRSSFPGSRRGRPFKFLGRGGFYVRGASPYGGERGPFRRRWSEDDGSAAGDAAAEDGEEAENESRTMTSQQPVHTVLIDNEEYTKIQTPRQEVIFKKSSLDRKRDSIDMGSAPSTCDSVNGCDPSSQGDQVSVAGSVEEATLSSGEDLSQDTKEAGHFEEGARNHVSEACGTTPLVDRESVTKANSMFIGEPGKPPLAGVVMQPAYPGGPMISIPVHWTPFLDPGLIPGDTALTPLDPAFTHVIDPKDLPADSAHILPVQHDSNGCPVTVQVKVNSEGQPVEIEPSVLTVSLSTLEPHQQEVLLRKSNDLISGTQMQTSIGDLYDQDGNTVAKESKPIGEIVNKERVGIPDQSENATSSEIRSSEKREMDHKEGEESSSDSQYASMSEASTAPTTPSGELSDPSESSESSKSRTEKLTTEDVLSEKGAPQVSRSDSLLDSESYDADVNEEPHQTHDTTSEVKENRADESIKSSYVELNDESPSIEKESDKEEWQNDLSIAVTPEQSFQVPCSEIKISSLTNPKSDFLSEKSQTEMENPKKNKRNKKNDRSLSIDSSISSQNSCGDPQLDNKEPMSKHQVKRNAKKLKKEKKRANKEKSKMFTNSIIIRNNNNDDSEQSPLSMYNSLNYEKSGSSTSSDSDAKCSTCSMKSDETSFEISLPSTEKESLEHLPLSNNSDNFVLCSENELDTEKTFESLSPSHGFDVTRENRNTETSETVQLNEVETSENSCINNESDSGEDKRENEDESIAACESKSTEEPATGEKEDAVNCDETCAESIGSEVKGETMVSNEEDESSLQSTKPNEETGTSSETSDDKNDENYTCKPGFVMVPILTPYYDPAVLYGYPLIIPEAPPERNYSRKKKKKFKKKYHEEVYLDTELYTGEPFVATPNGYMVPVDSSQIYHVHGYHYMPNIYSHILPDEGFVSIDQPSYLPESIPEPVYRMEMERHNKKYQRTYNGERKQNEKNIQESTCKEELKQKQQKDFNESCDSGVSESEDPNLLSLKGEKDQILKNEAEKNLSPTKQKAKDDKLLKSGETGKPSTKTQSKKKNKISGKEKSKKEITQILEPDFSSFNTSSLKFEFSAPNEEPKPKLVNKKTKNRKKRQNKKKNLNNEAQKENDAEIEEVKSSRNDTVESKGEIEQEIKSESCDTTVVPHSQDETPSGNAESEVLKESNEVQKESNFVVSKKPKAGRKRKNVKKGSNNYKENSVGIDNNCTSTAKKCLANENFDDQLRSKDFSSQESVNLGTSDECLSQGSTNVTTTPVNEYKVNANECDEPLLRQKSAKEYCSNHEVDEAEINQNDIISQQIESDDRPNFITDTNDDNKEYILHNVVSNNESRESEYENDEKEEYVSLKFDENQDLHSVQSSSPLNISSNYLENTEVLSESSFSGDCLPSCSTEMENVLKMDTLESSLISEEDSGATFKDLGVTEAVRRWIREVTPQKAFAFNEENRSLLLSSVIDSDVDDDEISDEDGDNVSDDSLSSTNKQPKNVKGNPFAASPSELGASSVRVASCFYLGNKKLRSEQTFLENQKLQNHPSQDILDDYDGESIVSGLSRGRLYSSSSSTSFPLVSLPEDTLLDDDPRVYDPNVYSKYYQLGIDIYPTPSNSSTRESTLSPSPVEPEDIDISHRERDLTPTSDLCSKSIATEFLKSEKIRANMSHISPSSLENTLPLPYCGCSGPLLNDDMDCFKFSGAESSHGKINEERRPTLCSLSSSGIGSSLASTPNLSPAHRLSSETNDSKPKLEPYPLVNLSVKEGSVPCKAGCCSIM